MILQGIVADNARTVKSSSQQKYTEDLVLINYCFLDSPPVAFADADKIVTQVTCCASLL